MLGIWPLSQDQVEGGGQRISNGGVTIFDVHFEKTSLAAVGTKTGWGTGKRKYRGQRRDGGAMATVCLDTRFGGEAPFFLWFPGHRPCFPPPLTYRLRFPALQPLDTGTQFSTTGVPIHTTHYPCVLSACTRGPLKQGVPFCSGVRCY